jgi:hypothetical protein
LKMRKVPLLVAWVLFVLLAPAVTPGILHTVSSNPGTVEIAYDDGVADGSAAWSSCATICMFAVRFTSSVSGVVKTVRYYVYSDPAAVKIHIMDQNKADLVTPFTSTPSGTGWFDEDISSKAVSITSGVDFYLALEWISSSMPNPDLGLDSSSPDMRSYKVVNGVWTLYYVPINIYVDLMIRAVIDTAPPPSAPSVYELDGFTSLPTGNMTMVIGDLALNPHGSKPSGVFYQQGRDTTPLGYLRGMVNNAQPCMFDTNSSVDANGRPGGAWPLIFTIGGPDINSVTHYYEHTDVAADRAPVTWSEEGTDVIWRFANGTEVVRVTQASTNVPPGTSDVFAIQVLRDADGRLVVLMYGERYTGTWAAAEYFKFIVYPTITSYTDSYYIVQWTDAASGTSANFMPDSGDTFTILAQGTP